MAESCPEDSIVPETVTNKFSEQSETNKIISEDSKNNEDRSKENKICIGDNQELIEGENQEVCKNIERNDEEFPVHEEDNQNLEKIIPKGSHMNCEYFNENSSDNVAEDICSNTEISKTVKESCSTEKLPDGNDEINSREDITKNSLPHQNEVNADAKENKQDEKQPTHLCSVKSIPLIDLTNHSPQACEDPPQVCEDPPQAFPSEFMPDFHQWDHFDITEELEECGLVITLDSDSESEENENSISLKRKSNEEDFPYQNLKRMHYAVDPETKISYHFPVITEDGYPVIDILSYSQINDCENPPQKENQNAENEMEISVNNVNDNSNELIEILDDSTKELDESNIEEQSCEDPSQEENDKNAEKENDGANDEHCDSKELDYEDVNN